MKRLLLVLFCLSSGCATIDEFRWRQAPEGPTSWRAGFIDGCMSGRQDARGINQPDVDKHRFRSDDQYRSGWQQGRDECFQREQEALAAPPPRPEPEPAEVEAASASAPVPAPAPLPVAVPSPVAAAEPAPPAADGGGRRAEIEGRIAALKREIASLEAELKSLPE